MKISELKKGDSATMKNVGLIKITGVSKKYIKVEAEHMTMKIQFACNAAPLSDLGITITRTVQNG
jgi:hypothetical protein